MMNRMLWGLGICCALTAVAVASDAPAAGDMGDRICPVQQIVVEATIYDTSLVEPQIQGGWPWDGPVSVVRDHLPPHGGAGELPMGPPNNLEPGSVGGAQRAMAEGGGFDGIQQTRWTPPDPTLAAGPDHIVTTVNSSIAFYTKAGQLQFSVPIDNTGNPGFFEDVGAGNFVVDPKVLYDHRAGRFVVMAIEVYSPNSAWIDIAVSDDSDPNGVWYKYRTRAEVPVGGAIYWVDYPSFGYDGDAYYTGGNLFRLRGSGGSTAGILFRVFDKAPMLDGDPVTISDLVYSQSFSAQAGLHFGNNQAGYYISVNNGSSLRLYAIEDPAGNPTLVTTAVTVPNFTPSSRFSAPNNGGNVDPLDGRVFQVCWRDGRLYTGHSVNVSGANKARWYQINTGDWPNSGTPSLVQSGNIDLGGGIHTYFPALFENAAGDVGMVFARSASNEFVSVQITGRSAGDPPGEMGEPTELMIGDQSASGRWGDYYAIAMDPTDDLTFWVIGEYSKRNVGWATWIESFTMAMPQSSGPVEFEVTRGALAGGDIDDLLTSDDMYVDVEQRRPTEIAANSVEIEVTGSLPTETPSQLSLAVEAATSGDPTLQTIDVFNYDAGTWDRIDERSGPSDDTLTIVSVGENPGRYVGAGGEVKARIGYSDRDVTFVGWNGRFDLVEWRFFE